MEAQQSQAHAAWAAAVLSLLSVIGLGITWWQTRRTANAAVTALKHAEKQNSLAHWQTIRDHRPKLIVRKVMLRHELPKDLRQHEPVFFQFDIVNTGGSEATIEKINVSMWHQFAGKKFFTDYGCEEEVSVLGQTLQSGQSMKAVVRVTGEDHGDQGASAAVGFTRTNSDGTQKLELTGTIVYSDANGTARTTEFLRRYIPSEQRFVPSDNPDNEYAD